MGLFSNSNKRGALTNPPAQVIDNKIQSQASKFVQFPEDLAGHSILLNFVKYQWDSATVSTEDTHYSVALPLPISGIVDNNQLNWSEQELGLLGRGAADIANDLKANFNAAMGGGTTSTQTSMSEGDAKQFMDKALAAGAAFFRSEVLPSNLQQGVNAGLGNIVNPHVAMLFTGVPLKNFSFTWKLAPRTQNESDILRDIIRDIKKNIYPKYGDMGDSVYLKYPNVCDLFYVGSNDYLHNFKRAAVKGINVNYQSEQNAFYAGTGAPAFVEIQMDFQEMEIWTSEDFDSANETT